MTRSLALALLVLAAPACAKDPAPTPAAAPPAAPAGSATPAGSAAPPAPAPPPAAPSAMAMFDALDGRKPLPLLPMMAAHQRQNMRDHLAAVQAIVAALAVDDFAAVEAATKRIGFSQDEAAMCNHMGAGAPTFIDQALAFHHTADTIGDAARAKDKAKALTALGATLEACTGCHATWKQQIVDEPTWTRLTGSPPPMAMEGMAGMAHGDHGAH